MNMKNLNFVTALIVFLFSTTLFSQISGTVYRDFNGNGIKEAGEPLISGVIVKAFLADGSQCGVNQITTSGSAPNYIYSGCSGVVRIEFELPTSNSFPNGPLAGVDFSSFIGTDNSTSVQFVNSSQTNVNYGIFYPGGYYSQDVNNIKLTVPTYNSGDITDITSNGYNDKAIITFPYLANGREDQADQSGTDNYTSATAGEVGTTWGLAYQKDKKRLFASTVLKRHMGLTASGIGIIWKIDMTDPTNAGTPSIFYDFGALAGTVGTNSSRDIQVDKTANSIDVEAFSKAGKVGFGDIELSDDGNTLYVVNLFDRKIYKIGAAGSTGTAVQSLPDFPNPGCSNGVARPWALKFWRGKLYIGLICDASTGGSRADLNAFVYEFDPVANIWNTTPRISFSLDYPKGGVIGSQAPYWNPWTDIFSNFEFKGGCYYCGFFHPQPILSDIEFDEEGSMHLAFIDRSGFQTGHRNALPTATVLNKELTKNNGNGIASGDILRTYLNPLTGLYELEEDGKSGPYTSSGIGTGNIGAGGVNSTQGPSKTNPGEFYWDDQINGRHSEISVGGLVYVPGQQEIVLSVFDPITIDAGGIEAFNIFNGSSTRRYQMYFGDAVNEGGPGKANGMGDIEIIGEVPPIQIGNRIWNDFDNNGIQDPDESPIAGVTVQLLNSSGIVIATAITNNTGNYYFTNGSGTSTTSSIYGIIGLTENTNYTIRIPNASGAGQQSALATYSLTTANVGGAAGDIRDSDGILIGNNAEASVLSTQIPIAGANNHTYDFGFLLLATCSLTSTGLSNVQCNNNGTPAITTDDYITFSLNPSGTILGTTYTVSANNGGILTPSSGTYGAPTNFSLQNGSANGTTTYTLTITDASGAPCQITVNVGPVSPCSSCPNPNCGTVNVTRN